jgi:hypothetical protein
LDDRVTSKRVRLPQSVQRHLVSAVGEGTVVIVPSFSSYGTGYPRCAVELRMYCLQPYGLTGTRGHGEALCTVRSRYAMLCP